MSSKFSNLASRMAVAVVAIPLILLACYHGGIYFLLFVLVIGAMALTEFYGLARAKGALPQTATGIAGLAVIHLSFFHEKLQSAVLPMFIEQGGVPLLTKLQLFLTVFLIFLVLVMLIELFRNNGSAFLNASATIFGVIYVGLFLGTLTGLRELFGNEFPYHMSIRFFADAAEASDAAIHAMTYAWGGWTVIAILASIWMCDTMAYFGGLSMGKHKLFPRVSPNKSWEGAVWGFFGAVGTMLLFRTYALPYLALHQAIVIGVIVGVFGQIGDLIESLLKRDAGVKDSSALIPGHGGFFDRFDSLIYVSPILYLYIDFVVLS